MDTVEIRIPPRLLSCLCGLTLLVEEALLKFKGADWVGMVFGLISTYYLAKERRAGFVYGVVCGVGWMAFGFLTASIASIISNLFFIVFNCHGFFRWKRKQEERKKRGC